MGLALNREGQFIGPCAEGVAEVIPYLVELEGDRLTGVVRLVVEGGCHCHIVSCAAPSLVLVEGDGVFGCQNAFRCIDGVDHIGTVRIACRSGDLIAAQPAVGHFPDAVLPPGAVGGIVVQVLEGEYVFQGGSLVLGRFVGFLDIGGSPGHCLHIFLPVGGVAVIPGIAPVEGELHRRIGDGGAVIQRQIQELLHRQGALDAAVAVFHQVGIDHRLQVDFAVIVRIVGIDPVLQGDGGLLEGVGVPLAVRIVLGKRLGTVIAGSRRNDQCAVRSRWTPHFRRYRQSRSDRRRPPPGDSSFGW